MLNCQSIMARQLSLLCSSLLFLLLSASASPPPPSFDSSGFFDDYSQVPPPPPRDTFPTSPAPPPAPYPPFDSDYWGGYFDDDTPPVANPPPPAPCNPEDMNTLLQVKKALNNSAVLSSWTPSTDCCCYWQYVGCNAATGRVVELYLYDNGWPSWPPNALPRLLPSAVGNLTYLQTLQFYNNATGPIPPALARLQYLNYLDLSHNQFNGRIPDFLGRMPQLLEMDLSGNRLSGPIPPSLTNSSTLQSLKLGGNRLTGVIPSSLFHLKYMDKYLITLDLSYNRFTGPIPRAFEGVNFWRLALAGNRLTGDASFVFGKGKGVAQIDLSRNRLSFNLSSVEVPPKLSWINLSQNKIYGGLPPIMSGLDYFNVSYNRLCGQIPQGGSFQKFDQSAYAHNKCLCGAPLPAC